MPLTRRTLAKGAAWSVPVIAAASAAPAVAASQPLTYWAEGSWHAYYQTDSSCNTQVWLTAKDPVSNFLPGFDISYTAGEGVDTTATLDSVRFILALPKGLVTTFSVNGGNWRYVGQQNPSYITLQDGSRPYVGSDFYVYTFEFTGTKTNSVVVENRRSTWPGSVIDALSPRNNYCTGYRDIPLYAGYLVSYHTANGYSMTDGSIINPGVIQRY